MTPPDAAARTGQPGQTSGGGWVPIPDPTTLTTEAVTRATEVFRREITALRELHDKDMAALQVLMAARMDAMDAAVSSRFEQVTAASVEHAAARDKAVGGLREIMEERLGAMDRASQLLAQDLRAVPSAVEQSIVALRELMESRLAALDQAIDLAASGLAKMGAGADVEHVRIGKDTAARLAAEREYIMSQTEVISTRMAEKFAAVDKEFAASKDAVAAALQAAKEAVSEQNKTNAAAIGKSEANTKEQLTSLGQVSSANFKAMEDKIGDARDRLTAIESITRGIEQAGGKGTSTARFEESQRRALIASVISALAVLVSIASVIILVVRKLPRGLRARAARCPRPRPPRPRQRVDQRVMRRRFPRLRRCVRVLAEQAQHVLDRDDSPARPAGTPSASPRSARAGGATGATARARRANGDLDAAVPDAHADFTQPLSVQPEHVQLAVQPDPMPGERPSTSTLPGRPTGRAARAASPRTRLPATGRRTRPGRKVPPPPWSEYWNATTGNGPRRLLPRRSRQPR